MRVALSLPSQIVMAGAAQTSHANSTESSETEIAGLASGPASHLGALHTAFRSQPAAATVPFPDLSSRSSSSLLSPSLFFPSLSSSSLWPRAGEKEKAAAWSERLEDVTQSSGTRQAEDRVVSTNYARRSANVMRPAELLQLETATVANHALAALTVILFVAVMVFRCRHRQAGHTRDVGLVMSSSRSKKPAARRGCWLSRLWVRPFRYLVCQWGRLRLKLSSCAAGEAYKGPVLGAAAGRTEICAEAQMERAAVDGGHILFCDQTMGSAIRSLTRRSSPTATRLAETAVAFSENFKPGSASLRPNGHPLLTTSRRVEERRHNVGTSTRVAAGILGAAVRNHCATKCSPAILSKQHIAALRTSLPVRLRGMAWRLAFSTNLHGCSLQTFYRKIQGWGACIIAVMDEQVSGPPLSHWP